MRGDVNIELPVPVIHQATTPSGEVDADYWHGLINEELAARFLGCSVRSIQGWRYRGGGPRYCRLSGRNIRYRRIDCYLWAEEHIRTSTSDPGVNGL